MTKYFCILFLLFVVKFGISETSKNVYQWDFRVDIPILIGGTIFGITSSLYFQKQTNSLRVIPETKDFSLLDRWIVKQYSPNLSFVSDVGNLILGVVPIVLITWSLKVYPKSVFWTELLMYGEVLVISSSLNLWSRSLFIHPRPFVYNSKANLNRRKRGEAHRSFYSGHVSGAFAVALFFNRQIKTYFDSKYTPLTQILSLTTATGVASLRVLSGKHFVEDVLVGVAVGSFVSWIIPWLHQRESDRFDVALGLQKIVFYYNF